MAIAVMKPGLVLLLLLMLIGCGSGVQVAVQESTKHTPPVRLAVLFLDNLSGKDKASEKVTEYLLQSFSKMSQLHVAEPGTVYDVLRKNRIRSTTTLTSEQVASLGAELGVSLLVTGSVIDYTERDNQYLGKIPTVAFTIRVIEVATGRTVMTAIATDRGDRKTFLFGIGSVRSCDVLAQRLCDDLARQLAGKITK
jgi:TolB-like protein